MTLREPTGRRRLAGLRRRGGAHRRRRRPGWLRHFRFMSGLAAFTAAAAVGAGSLAFADTEAPGNAGSPDTPEGYRLPEEAPQPGTGFRIGAVYRVQDGTLTYSCTGAPDGTGAWSAVPTPEATLRGPDNRPAIRHTADRFTATADGSTIVAAPAPVARGTGPGGVPWLLLNVAEHRDVVADGELAAIAFVSVLNTAGGAPPSTPCVPGFDTGRSARYAADYVFWAPTNPGG